jgi:hypothetical protein
VAFCQAWQGKKNVSHTGQQSIYGDNPDCLVKRRWALLASNPTRDSQARAGRTCPLGPGCAQRSRDRLSRSAPVHSFCPACLENAAISHPIRFVPPTDSADEPIFLHQRTACRAKFSSSEESTTLHLTDEYPLAEIRNLKTGLGWTGASTTTGSNWPANRAPF